MKIDDTIEKYENILAKFYARFDWREDIKDLERIGKILIELYKIKETELWQKKIY